MLQLLRHLLPTVLVCLYTTSAWAHGPAQEYIVKLTKQIEKSPLDATLYVERGGYYKEDGNFDQSFADYQTARILDPTLATVDFLLAELYFEFEHYHSALVFISSFQNLKINTEQCYMLKAKIFDRLFISDSALFYAEAAYPHISKFSTHYFVTTKEYVLFNDKNNYERASYWLTEGKKRMPHDLVIQEEYVQLALKFNDFDKAIELCNEKIRTLKRKEYWYYLLATAQNGAGSKQAADQSLDKAVAAIERLPRHHKRTGYISTLRKDIVTLKEQLKT